jgi:EAL and modified HD-GYP domain-containing signal transduction protein
MKTSIREARAGAQAALVARQPIFDSRFTVIAHELLYRTETKSDSSLPRDGGLATARVIVDSCLEIGLDRLTGAVPAHINFPRELLVGNAPLPVDPHRVVIEVLEDVRADSDVINALSTWRQRGHRIALDDFSFEESDTGLLAFAHIVKLDVQQLSLRRFERTYEELRNRKLILIAEKVETVEEFERCKALGFDAFQGYFLGRPELFRGRRVPTNRLATFRILAQLQNPEVDAAALEQLVARDAGTSYRILRCIKSSYYGLPRPIDSLRQAIIVLGIEELRRLCAAVLLGRFDDRPVQLLLNTLIRARMCELLAIAGGVRETGPYFMTGLFSTLDALLGVSLEEALDTVPLADPVVRALLHGEGDLARKLRCVQDYESGKWDALGGYGLSNQQLLTAYIDALEWADGATGFLAPMHA